MKVMNHLENLLTVLTKLNIDFVIIGGFAAMVHGSSQVTQDLDICCLLTEEQIATLREGLKNYNPRHRMTTEKLSFIDHPKQVAGIKNLYLETNLVVLDILSSVAGLGGFDQVVQGAMEIKIDGEVCKILSLEKLIKAKEAMSRLKDKLTVQELKVIAEELSLKEKK